MYSCIERGNVWMGSSGEINSARRAIAICIMLLVGWWRKKGCASPLCLALGLGPHHHTQYSRVPLRHIQKGENLEFHHRIERAVC